MTQLLRRFDLFHTTHLIRYKGEPEYKTATGGLVSIIVIALNIILFYSMGLLTINRELITYSIS